MLTTTPIQRHVRLVLGIAGFLLWAYLLIDGRSLPPTTTFALLTLILAAIGLGHLAPQLGWDTGPGGDNDDK